MSHSEHPLRNPKFWLAFLIFLVIISALAQSEDRSQLRAKSAKARFKPSRPIKAQQQVEIPQPIKETKIERERKAEQIERQLFIAAFTEEIDKACASKAVFKKILGRWHVSVPEVGALSVATVYPEDKNKIIRAIERIGAGDPVSFKDFCQDF